MAARGKMLTFFAVAAAMAAAFGSAFVAGAPPALAQAMVVAIAPRYVARFDRCTNADGRQTLNDILAACDGLIENNRLDARQRAAAQVYCGEALRRSGEAARAFADYNGAAALDPTYAPPFFYRARAYALADEPERAIADFDEAIRLEPGYASAFEARGDLYRRLGQRERALADYDAAIRHQPWNPAFLNARCWARAVWGLDLDLAVADCTLSLSFRGDHADTLDSRALAHFKRGDFESAFADYDAAVRLDPDDAHPRYGRGLAQLRLGRTALGQADIAAALARNDKIAERYAGYGVTPES